MRGVAEGAVGATPIDGWSPVITVVEEGAVGAAPVGGSDASGVGVPLDPPSGFFSVMTTFSTSLIGSLGSMSLMSPSLLRRLRCLDSGFPLLFSSSKLLSD